MIRCILLAALLIVASTMLGCSWQRAAYSAGQGWQRTECNRVSDPAERQQCMTRADAAFENYQRQVEEARAPR
ncbi:hypothetical protein [Cupriavidus basilensis]|uniref:hypothetical protein n=1 Tax=Cupriavidus basilensis TaxID=68895 RepID=UPI0003477CBA|nr:hypothetical protein [Cupriavidus basilensis]